MNDTAKRKSRMLIVGAFPKRDPGLHGGILTSCRALMASSMPRRVEIIAVDSLSRTVPPPPFLHRLVRAVIRIAVTTKHIVWSKPDAALLFASPGSSFIEKSMMCAIARLFGVRTLMFPRGAELIAQYEASRFRMWLLGYCFRIPTVMLCQGKIYQEFFVNRIGLPIKRCPIVYNWTATPELLELGASRSERRASVPLEVLFLGWVDREKGIFELLECVLRLSHTSGAPTFMLIVAGNGSALSEAQRYTETHALTDRIRFPGWIDADEKVRLLRDADLLVLPSYVEGMPNAVIEAMSAGLPVVATDVGAVADVVDPGVSGFIVPPRNTDELFEALLLLLEDADLRTRMGRAGFKLATERFATERAVDQLLQIANVDASCTPDAGVGG